MVRMLAINAMPIIDIDSLPLDWVEIKTTWFTVPAFAGISSQL